MTEFRRFPVPGGEALQYESHIVVKILKHRTPSSPGPIQIRMKWAAALAKSTEMPVIIESQPSPIIQANIDTKHDARFYLKKALIEETPRFVVKNSWGPTGVNNDTETRDPLPQLR